MEGNWMWSNLLYHGGHSTLGWCPRGTLTLTNPAMWVTDVGTCKVSTFFPLLHPVASLSICRCVPHLKRLTGYGHSRRKDCSRIQGVLYRFFHELNNLFAFCLLRFDVLYVLSLTTFRWVVVHKMQKPITVMSVWAILRPCRLNDFG